MNIETISYDPVLIQMLGTLNVEAEIVSGQWDGDNSGRLEDIATNADEINETITKLVDLLAESQEL